MGPGTNWRLGTRRTQRELQGFTTGERRDGLKCESPLKFEKKLQTWVNDAESRGRKNRGGKGNKRGLQVFQLSSSDVTPRQFDRNHYNITKY